MREPKKFVLGAMFIVTGLGAVVAARPRLPEPSPTIPHQPLQNLDECPDVMRGMKFEITTIDGGVELHFTNPRTLLVDGMRQDLRTIAKLVEVHSASGPAKIPPIEISVDDIASGASVRIKPIRPGDLVQVRQLAVVLQTVWEGSDCARPHATI
jgi:hypothetical protein